MITLLRILKIGQHLAKLWATARCPGFYDSRGNTSTTAIITTTSSSRGSSSSRCIVYLSRWYTVDLPYGVKAFINDMLYIVDKSVSGLYERICLRFVLDMSDLSECGVS